MTEILNNKATGDIDTSNDECTHSKLKQLELTGRNKNQIIFTGLNFHYKDIKVKGGENTADIEFFAGKVYVCEKCKAEVIIQNGFVRNSANNS